MAINKFMKTRTQKNGKTRSARSELASVALIGARRARRAAVLAAAGGAHAVLASAHATAARRAVVVALAAAGGGVVAGVARSFTKGVTIVRVGVA